MESYSLKPRTLSEANKLNNLARKIDIPKKKLDELYIKRKLSCTKIAKMYNCHHSTVLKRMKEYNIKSRKLAEAMIIYPKKDFNGNLIEKAYLIGFRIGDLHVRKLSKNGKTLSVEGSTTKLEQINLIKGLFNKYGHFNQYNFIGPKGKKEIRINFNLNDTFNFLLEKNTRIPEWILENDKYFFSFLAGYTDAEGHIGVHLYGSVKKATFQLASYDKYIIKQIHNKLISLGLNSKLRISAKKGYISKNKGYPYRRDMWSLSLFAKESLSFLFSRLDPYLKHRNRVDNLNKAVENINLRNNKFGNLRMNNG